MKTKTKPATPNSIETFVEVTEGMEIDRGYISPQFVNNPERLLAEYDNCRVLVRAACRARHGRVPECGLA